MGGRLPRGLTAVACAVACLAAFTACSSDDPEAGPPASGAASGADASPGTGPDSDPSGTASGDGQGGSDGATDDGQGGDGGSDGSVDTEGQPSASPEPSGLPGLEPPDLGPMVEEPLPKAASATGRLVPGYPSEKLPTAPRSRIRTSSVSPSDERLQVAVTASTTLPPERVLRFYRLHLAGLGFQERPTSAVGGSTAAAFERGTNSLVVTVTPGKAATAYSLFGTLTTEEG